MADQPHPRLQELAHKWRAGTLTDAERQEFDVWFHADEQEPQEVDPEFGHSAEEQSARLYARIKAEIKTKPQTYRLWPRLAAAASILLVLSAGGYFFLHQNKPPQQTAQHEPHDVAPGGNKAILTLASGQKIVLAGKANGSIAQQGSSRIDKTADSVLEYAVSGQTESAVYNTLTTPRKGRYVLVMADGTEVTLDAASSITYPVAFTGKNRKVSITGQVYFKVKHDPEHPFSVSYKGQTTEDIGTEFNINAYDDEPAVKTTLISGKAKVKKEGRELLLDPGQQAVVTGSLPARAVSVDIDAVTAWKNNYFQFEGDNLGSIMRKVSRWYDVEISYDDPALQSQVFTGTVSRFKNVSSVLNKLELTGAAHFKLANNTITITR